MKIIKNIAIAGLPVYVKASDEAAMVLTTMGKYRYSTKGKFKSILNRGNIIFKKYLLSDEKPDFVSDEIVNNWVEPVKISFMGKLINFFKQIFNKLKLKFV